MSVVPPLPAPESITTVYRPQDRGTFAQWRTRRWQQVTGLHDLPARLALRATNSAPFRQLLGARYHTAIVRHHACLPPLGTIDRDIVCGLHEHGVFVTSLDALALEGSASLLRAGRAAADAFANEARRRVRAGSDFNVAPPASIHAAPEIFQWGVSQRLLAIAECYLELPVAYDGVSVNYTVADGRAVSTRKWHRDWEDRRMVKVAVYLNDVDTAGGPFEMVSRVNATQNDETGFHYNLATDDELARLLGDNFHADIVSCLGAAGTVIFTDTAGFFHRGKPATDRDRAALFYSYFARSPRHPFLCERSGLSRSDIKRLSRGLTAAQRAATSWRQYLPLLLRLIPSARI